MTASVVSTLVPVPIHSVEESPQPGSTPTVTSATPVELAQLQETVKTPLRAPPGFEHLSVVPSFVAHPKQIYSPPKQLRPACTVFISGALHKIPVPAIYKALGRFGHVRDVMFKENNKYGFAEFYNSQEAFRAIAAGEVFVGQFRIYIKEKTESPKRGFVNMAKVPSPPRFTANHKLFGPPPLGLVSYIIVVEGCPPSEPHRLFNRLFTGTLIGTRMPMAVARKKWRIALVALKDRDAAYRGIDKLNRFEWFEGFKLHTRFLNSNDFKQWWMKPSDRQWLENMSKLHPFRTSFEINGLLHYILRDLQMREKPQMLPHPEFGVHHLEEEWFRQQGYRPIPMGPMPYAMAPPPMMFGPPGLVHPQFSMPMAPAFTPEPVTFSSSPESSPTFEVQPSIEQTSFAQEVTVDLEAYRMSPSKDDIFYPGPLSSDGHDASPEVPNVTPVTVSPTRPAYIVPEIPPASGPPADPTNIYVKNLCDEVVGNVADFERIFGKFGEIASVHLPTYPDSTLIRGYGMVRYKKEASAKAAIKSMNGTWFGRKQILVVYYEPADRREKRFKEIFAGDYDESKTRKLDVAETEQNTTEQKNPNEKDVAHVQPPSKVDAVVCDGVTNETTEVVEAPVESIVEVEGTEDVYTSVDIETVQIENEISVEVKNNLSEVPSVTKVETEDTPALKTVETAPDELEDNIALNEVDVSERFVRELSVEETSEVASEAVITDHEIAASPVESVYVKDVLKVNVPISEAPAEDTYVMETSVTTTVVELSKDVQVLDKIELSNGSLHQSKRFTNTTAEMIKMRQEKRAQEGHPVVESKVVVKLPNVTNTRSSAKSLETENPYAKLAELHETNKDSNMLEDSIGGTEFSEALEKNVRQIIPSVEVDARPKTEWIDDAVTIKIKTSDTPMFSKIKPSKNQKMSSLNNDACTTGQLGDAEKIIVEEVVEVEQTEPIAKEWPKPVLIQDVAEKTSETDISASAVPQEGSVTIVANDDQKDPVIKEVALAKQLHVDNFKSVGSANANDASFVFAEKSSDDVKTAVDSKKLRKRQRLAKTRAEKAAKALKDDVPVTNGIPMKAFEDENRDPKLKSEKAEKVSKTSLDTTKKSETGKGKKLKVTVIAIETKLEHPKAVPNTTGKAKTIRKSKKGKDVNTIEDVEITTGQHITDTSILTTKDDILFTQAKVYEPSVDATATTIVQILAVIVPPEMDVTSVQTVESPGGKIAAGLGAQAQATQAKAVQPVYVSDNGVKVKVSNAEMWHSITHETRFSKPEDLSFFAPDIDEEPVNLATEEECREKMKELGEVALEKRLQEAIQEERGSMPLAVRHPNHAKYLGNPVATPTVVVNAETNDLKYYETWNGSNVKYV